MVLACVLIGCKAGKYSKVVNELKKLKDVKKALGVQWDGTSSQRSWSQISKPSAT